jgi:hypothetical protein
MHLLTQIGSYFLLMIRTISRPEKFSILYRQTMREIQKTGINSFSIVVIISLFVGAVITIQTNFNIENPLLPRYLVGVTVRDSLLLEFSSTMVALILAGKVGSSIASELGMMRITEQIDALEVMGVNSASYLILPKVIASVLFFPILCLLSIIVGLAGGYFFLCGGRYYSPVRIHLWHPVCLLPLLHRVCTDQNRILCLHYHLRFFLFRLLCERRSRGGGKVQHQGSGSEQHPHPAGQPDPYQNHPAMIEVKNLYKSFDGEFVLNDVSARFEQGEMQPDHWPQRFRKNRFA